jgi:uncharacterized protein
VEDLGSVAVVFLAAITAGAMNAVVGAGTIITFPTLLAVGIPPVTANVSNTVGLVPGGLAGAYAFRATLRERGPLLRRLIVASSVGGLLGGALLLFLPADTFELVIPPLLVLSGILAAVQPRVTSWVARRRQRTADDAPDDAPLVRPGFTATPPLLAAVAATGIYGGYFGAAQGVILLALLGVFFAGDLTAANGTKNVLAAVANIVSALLFIVLADVDWSIAATIAVGSTIGGGLGGRYGRRLRPGPLRVAVVVVAFTAAAWQLLT